MVLYINPANHAPGSKLAMPKGSLGSMYSIHTSEMLKKSFSSKTMRSTASLFSMRPTGSIFSIYVAIHSGPLCKSCQLNAPDGQVSHALGVINFAPIDS